MRINDFERALKLANEFLGTKERLNYYDFKAIDEERLNNVVYTNNLTNEEVTQLRALKEKYGEEYVKHLEEVFGDPDIIHDLTLGREIVDIDLDRVLHKYSFKIHEIKPDNTVGTSNIDVELSDDNYARLLAWHLCDEHLTFNALWFCDQKLYTTIMNEFESLHLGEFTDCDNPYVPTFDEAKADADAIITRQHDIHRDDANK